MDEITAVATPEDFAAAAPQPVPDAAPPLRTWIREGLRAGFLLEPRVVGTPRPWHLIVLLVAVNLLDIGLARLEVPGAARFNVAGWLAPWWTAAALLLLVWTLTWRQQPGAHAGDQPQGLASWMTLWTVATVPLMLLAQALMILSARDALPAGWADSGWYGGLTALLVAGWMIALLVLLGRHFGMGKGRTVLLVAGVIAIQSACAVTMNWRPWYADAPYEDDEPKLSLNQEGFERQQAVWQQAVASLAPQRDGVRDVYGIVFSPYASEDVFLRESTMVADVLAQRFDAKGRVLHLANHPGTSDRLPWATPLNLQRGIEAIAQRMDRERDVLVVYLTSHGGSNFKLAATHWPLQVDPVTPAGLRRVLDEAGIRNRVIAISACFSGGWVGPLAGDSTLVMTAADAQHTSYGCGSRSELTFFGRAVVDEQLRGTHSFEQAFAAAVPVIRQREIDAKKADGFSNPQISVGGAIRPVLEEVAARLEGEARP